MVLILLCFLLQALSDQQDSYLIKTSTILYCATSLFAALFAALRSQIDGYLYYTLQLSITTIAHTYFQFLIAGMLSFAFQLQNNEGLTLFSFVPIYLVIYSADKLLAVLILNLVILDYGNSAYYLASVTFVLSIILFVVNQAHSLYAKEQYIFGKPVASTKQIRTAEQLFELLNQPNNVHIFYSREDDATVMSRLRMQRFQTLLQSITYHFVSNAVLNAQYASSEQFYWLIYLYDLIVLACIAKCADAITKKFENANFGITIGCAIGMCVLVIVEVLQVETSTDCRVASLVFVYIVQMLISFLSIFSFGNCDMYEKTTYKYMIYAYLVGSQVANLLLNITEIFQGARVYISSGVCVFLCICSCGFMHLHKLREKLIQSE